MREALGVEVPDADGVAGMMLAALDGISLGMQIDPERVPLDEVFADLRRVISFMVAARLNPELAHIVRQPRRASCGCSDAAARQRSKDDAQRARL